MKPIIYISLIIGALMLPASMGIKVAAIGLIKSIASSIERLVMRGDYAEVRMVDGEEFDLVINEPGRVVIVVIQNELSTASRSEAHDFDEEIKKLPAKVLVAKVIAERNESLLRRLNIPKLPNVRVYNKGKLVREFKGKVDEVQLLSTVRYYLENPSSSGERIAKGYIGPMDENWMPKGVEIEPSKKKVPTTRLD